MGETVPPTPPIIPGGFGFDCECWTTGKTPAFMTVTFSGLIICPFWVGILLPGEVNDTFLLPQWSEPTPCYYSKLFTFASISLLLIFERTAAGGTTVDFRHPSGPPIPRAFFHNEPAACSRTKIFNNDLVVGGCGEFQFCHDGQGVVQYGDFT